MDEVKSKVYIQTDDQNRITRCEGGYSMGNIQNIEDWLFIDEGNGDRFNLCQAHYFDGGLYTEDGVARWKYEDGACVLRSEAEIAADRANRQTDEPTSEERFEAQLLYTAMMTDTLLEG